MTRFISLVASLLMVFALGDSRLAADRAIADDEPLPAHVAAPPASFRDAHGNVVDLARLRGRVVLLNFWATWCTGCKVEIPWYIAFDGRYRSAGLTTIGVAMDDDGWTAVKPYLAAHPIRYPIVLSNDAAARDYKATSLPVSVLIDRDGLVAASHVGVVDRDDWEKRIVALIAR